MNSAQDRSPLLSSLANYLSIFSLCFSHPATGILSFQSLFQFSAMSLKGEWPQRLWWAKRCKFFLGLFVSILFEWSRAFHHTLWWPPLSPLRPRDKRHLFINNPIYTHAYYGSKLFFIIAKQLAHSEERSCLRLDILSHLSQTELSSPSFSISIFLLIQSACWFEEEFSFTQVA